MRLTWHLTLCYTLSYQSCSNVLPKSNLHCSLFGPESGGRSWLPGHERQSKFAGSDICEPREEHHLLSHCTTEGREYQLVIKGPHARWEVVLWPQAPPVREGTALPLSQLLAHFLSRRRERKSCQRARSGAFRRFPPPTLIFHRLGSAPPEPEEHTLTFTLLAGNLKREQRVPTLRGAVGEGNAAQPLPWPRPAPRDRMNEKRERAARDARGSRLSRVQPARSST